MTQLTSTVTTTLLSGFDDPRMDRQHWDDLLQSGDSDVVNLTWLSQRAWWNVYGRGQLLLISAETNGRTTAVAPFFSDGRMVYNICPKDCLDFVGDVSDPAVLVALLEAARTHVPGCVGFQFYFIPESSQTIARLRGIAPQIGCAYFEMNAIPAPFIDLRSDPEAAVRCTRKQSLVRHENGLRRMGNLSVHHFRSADQILPNLPAFFEQHIHRRAATEHPSLFCDPKNQAYYERLTRDLSDTRWLRFTRLDLDAQPIAFHYGRCYAGRYLYGMPSFDIKMSKHSPGEVLLRQLLLAAIDEGAETFDFGMGDEAYKYRFSTGVTRLKTVGLFPATTSSSSASVSRPTA